MHPLTAHIARCFRRLEPLERQEVAHQLLGFLGAFIASEEAEWRSLLWTDGDGAMGVASSRTLIELLEETCTVEARAKRGS